MDHQGVDVKQCSQIEQYEETPDHLVLRPTIFRPLIPSGSSRVDAEEAIVQEHVMSDDAGGIGRHSDPNTRNDVRIVMSRESDSAAGWQWNESRRKESPGKTRNHNHFKGIDGESGCAFVAHRSLALIKF